jgi:DNA (cytosine-5)-methyltransferase 1
MGGNEIIVDSFAGGGGASLGIAWATGRAPDIAINHDPSAIAMHVANHPSTEHVLEDVWRADLRALTKGRPVGLLWASPDCKHFSRAKGGKPVEKRIRSLAWIVCRWADQVRPRIIALENVREFADWGPLVPRWVCRDCGWKGTEGQAVLMRTRRRCPACESKSLRETEDLVPCPARKGLTFRRFVGRLRGLGYAVEWRNLDAAEFGAPTHRRRLFLLARRDGEQICWPEPTRGRFRLPFRTAAECIDWSIPCPSIFDRKRPLAEKTMRRIALGIKRYVLDNPDPFIIQTSHTGTSGRGTYTWPADQPIRTLSQSNEFAVVTPIVSKFHGSKSRNDSRCHQLQLPFATVDTQPRFALVAPTLVTVGHGERAGQEARANSPQTALGTITSKGHHALVSAFLAKHFGGMVGVPITKPLPTTTARGTQNQIVAANIVHMNHGEKQWSGCDEPMRTLTSGKHAALVYSFLTRFFGDSIGQTVDSPAPTANGCNKTGLVTVQIEGEPFVIVDIGMRMLAPRELARAQGFPDTYELTGTKTSQVARIGNSVCPHVAAAIVRANCLEPAVVC